ncbi:MAG: tRNA pseudouridine(55) synthase TruB [Elusimicrobiota bacterium]|nr:MAG: tRNA pseudouridine(55) synthase TruB [Elusimicrobiota bacterium]
MSLAAPAGMLLVDKPTGWTSHDCVAVLRKLFPRGTKVGHAGTLDPLATGLLTILVGPCTRLQERLQGFDKAYSGTIRLGVRTDTGDITGKVVEEKPLGALARPAIEKAVAGLVGEIEAPAPAYSAVKHEGRKLYEYARAGEAIPVKPRKTTVRSWDVLGWEPPELSYRLTCSSGTYVRTMAELLGERLGVGGTVSALRRESVGPFTMAQGRPLEDWRKLPPGELAVALAESIPALEAALK